MRCTGLHVLMHAGFGSLVWTCRKGGTSLQAVHQAVSKSRSRLSARFSAGSLQQAQHALAPLMPVDIVATAGLMIGGSNAYHVWGEPSCTAVNMRISKACAQSGLMLDIHAYSTHLPFDQVLDHGPFLLIQRHSDALNLLHVCHLALGYNLCLLSACCC